MDHLVRDLTSLATTVYQYQRALDYLSWLNTTLTSFSHSLWFNAPDFTTENPIIGQHPFTKAPITINETSEMIQSMLRKSKFELKKPDYIVEISFVTRPTPRPAFSGFKLCDAIEWWWWWVPEATGNECFKFDVIETMDFFGIPADRTMRRALKGARLCSCIEENRARKRFLEYMKLQEAFDGDVVFLKPNTPKTQSTVAAKSTHVPVAYEKRTQSTITTMEKTTSQIII